jgi:hypothetical protein
VFLSSQDLAPLPTKLNNQWPWMGTDISRRLSCQTHETTKAIQGSTGSSTHYFVSHTPHPNARMETRQTNHSGLRIQRKSSKKRLRSGKNVVRKDES